MPQVFQPPTYFNEWKKYPASWLRRIYPKSVVDERSIDDVQPDELSRYRKCHFFSGIGGWELALTLAGWPPERRVWTGSCPCQPFSVGGTRKGESDDRHLWPRFFTLIRKLRPPTLFGEQVASDMGFGWLDGVRLDLENEGYSFGAACLPAGGVGSPQRRYRLFWMANRSVQGLQGRGLRSRQMPSQGNPWESGFDVVHCTDGKKRRFESGVLPLAYGVPHRMEQIEAYGNAIVPQVAAKFIRAFLLTEMD